jgi:hypothetical protein
MLEINIIRLKNLQVVFIIISNPFSETNRVKIKLIQIV